MATNDELQHTAGGNSADGGNWLAGGNAWKIAVGPALFFAVLIIPAFGPLQARVGFGILFWLAYYWVSGAVPLRYTIWVPLLAAALVPVIPLNKVVQAYVDKFILLIVATGFISAAWIHWGLARRIALRVLLLGGNSARSQTVLWFLLATAVSMVVADTITAVAFAPIAASVLVAAGYESVEDRWKCLSASNLLLALAWGSSHGGMTTPLGGGQALVLYSLLGKELGKNIAFIDFTLRMAPPTIFTAIFLVLFLRWGLRYDVEAFPGSREVYRRELAQMGPMNTGEWVSLVGFLVAVAVAFLEPLYTAKLKAVKIEPTLIFLLVAVAMFFIPANRNRERVLTEEIVRRHFPVLAVIVWPTAIALANLLEISGATKVIGGWLGPLAQAAPPLALAGFTGMAGLMTQFSTNTAANAICVPIAVAAMKAAGANIIPWALATGMLGGLGYAVVSAAGGIAVVVGYGANIRRMFTNGMIMFAIAFLANWLFWYLVIFVLKLQFYFRI